MRKALTITLVLMAPTIAWGQAAESAGSGGVAVDDRARWAAEAVRVDQGPALDGRLDDPIWAVTPAIHGFIQREPNEGLPATEDTEVRFAYTDEALYVGARMYGSPAEIRADVGRRDAKTDAEQLVLSFDTYLDRRTAYTFVVTAAGGRIDYLHPGDFEGNRDLSFDPVWEAEAVVDDQGWTAEVRIPFSQLRFSRSGPQTWGLNVKRVRPALQAESLWRLIRRDETGWASRMGVLQGITGIRDRRRVEVQPYIASSATMKTGIDAAFSQSQTRGGPLMLQNGYRGMDLSCCGGSGGWGALFIWSGSRTDSHGPRSGGRWGRGTSGRPRARQVTTSSR